MVGGRFPGPAPTGLRTARGRALALAIAVLVLVAPGAPARAAAPPTLDARAWILVDGRTGEQLAARAPGARLPIASATKLMTAHLALQRLTPDRRVTAAPYQPSSSLESLMGLRAGQRVSVRDLIYGLILRSGNDAALTIATAVSGSEPAFVTQMNRSAVALGLTDTHYENPIGFDAPGNYSSAYDLATQGRRLLRNRFFRRVAGARHAVLRSLRPRRSITTRNTLLFRAPWATGIKTGHTLGAGYVLVGSGRRKGVELVSAVLGAPSEYGRDSESLELLEYGFSLYRIRRPVRRGEELARAEIRFSGGQLSLIAGRAVAVGVRRGQGIEVRVEAPEVVEGPIRRGESLGEGGIYVDGRRAAVVPLLASRAVGEATSLEKATDRVFSWPVLLGVGGVVILIGGATLRRRRRRRAMSEEQMRARREQRRRMREQRRRGGGGADK